MPEYLSKSAGKTRKMGELLAKELLASYRLEPRKNSSIFALEGDLGGGKTTFLQGFARGLGVKEKILSPTFVVMRRFFLPQQDLALFHFDCYRIRDQKEILNLGFNEIISNPRSIVAIEWPEVVRKILPKDVIVIKFEFIDQNTRRIILSSKRF